MTKAALGRWKKEPTREEVAYHEAGHVIAAMLGWVPVRSVDMRAEAGQHHARVNSDDLLGRQILAGRMDVREGTVGGHLALGRIRYSLGGYAAESIFSDKRGLPHDGCGADVDYALAFAGAMLPGSGSATKDLMVEWIIVRQWRLVRAQLRRHWQHVTAVAALLMRNDEVDDDAIRALLRTLPDLACEALPTAGDDTRSETSIS